MHTHIFSVVAVGCSGLATLLSLRAVRASSRAERLAELREEREQAAELANLVLDTRETGARVAILAPDLEGTRSFATGPDVEDALAELRDYWKRNRTALRIYLGNTSRALTAVERYYEMARRSKSHPPPAGAEPGTDDPLFEFQIGEAFEAIAAALEKKQR